MSSLCETESNDRKHHCMGTRPNRKPREKEHTARRKDRSQRALGAHRRSKGASRVRWVGADRVREKSEEGGWAAAGERCSGSTISRAHHGEDRGGAPISPIAGRGGVCRDAVGGLARQGHHKQREGANAKLMMQHNAQGCGDGSRPPAAPHWSLHLRPQRLPAAPPPGPAAAGGV